MALQGNLDPAALFAPPAQLLSRVRDMLVAYGQAPLVANLGHGMLPSHDPTQLQLFLEAVGQVSAELRRGGSADEAFLSQLPCLARALQPQQA
jgi:uroporphyrinogen decarboxylase